VSGWALRIDGLPYLLTTKGVTSITTWSDGDDPGQTVAEDTLEPPDGDLSERLRPLEGEVDVSALSFVVHDLPLGSAQYGLSDLFTRRVNDLDSTYLTAAATAAATTFTVADSSIFTSLPRKAWINAEVVDVTAAPTATSITVTRAQYGTRAASISVSAAEAVLPEIYLRCPWLTRRRCVLYRVRGTTASVRWIGYADHAPRLNEDGASWTISATWAGQREMGVRLVSEQGGARTFGYDERAVRMILMRDSDGTVLATGQRSLTTGHIFNTFDECLRSVAARLRARIAATSGVTHATVNTSFVGSQLSVTVTAQGLDPFRLGIYIGDIQAEGNSVDTGSHKRATVVLNQPDLGGLAYLAFPEDTDVTSVFNNNKRTVIATAADFPTDNASWTTYVASYAVPVQVTPILSAQWDEQTRVVLDPRYQATAGTIELNSTLVVPPSTTFKGSFTLRATDANARYVPGWGTNRVGIAARGIFLFRREFYVDSEHWLYALRWVLSSTVTAVESDSRNWDWSRQAEIAGYTAAGSATAVRWRVDSSRTFGEFVADECLLRGATLSVRDGKLTVDALRPPTAAETVAVTITPAQLEQGRLPQWEEWEDGLRTSVTVVSPMREVTVVDRVAQMRHGDTASLRLRAEGLRDDTRMMQDPVAYARDIAMRPLRLFSDPTYLVRLPVTNALIDSVHLGDMIEITQAVLPDMLGGRGMSAVRGQVIGITEGLRSGSVMIEALVFAVEYGYAPCARVGSISGAVLTLSTNYAGSAGDYSGSTLTGYDGTVGDAGASRFVAGDKVLLIRRDYATLITEAHTVASVNPTGPTITLTSAPTAAWSTYPIVDVMYDDFGTDTATQRGGYAFVCSSTPPQIIGSTSEPGRKWAT
jgi:hypothetical protein